MLRSAESLDQAAQTLTELARTAPPPAFASWEATNLVTVASALVGAADPRQETRGCHWREDFPERRATCSAATSWPACPDRHPDRNVGGRMNGPERSGAAGHRQLSPGAGRRRSVREATARLRYEVGLDPLAVAEIVERTLTEDLGPDRLDVTSVATIPDTQVDAAELVVRAPGVVAGLAVAAAVFEAVSPRRRGLHPRRRRLLVVRG